MTRTCRVVVAALATAATLAACGSAPELDDSDPDVAAAIEVTRKSYEATFEADNPYAPPPRQYVTDAFYERALQGIGALPDQGYTTSGRDKIVWIKAVDRKDDAIATRICYEIHAQLLDAKGEDQRVKPDGSTPRPGDRLMVLNWLVDDRGTWKLDNVQMQGESC